MTTARTHLTNAQNAVNTLAGFVISSGNSLTSAQALVCDVAGCQSQLTAAQTSVTEAGTQKTTAQTQATSCTNALSAVPTDHADANTIRTDCNNASTDAATHHSACQANANAIQALLAEHNACEDCKGNSESAAQYAEAARVNVEVTAANNGCSPYGTDQSPYSDYTANVANALGQKNHCDTAVNALTTTSATVTKAKEYQTAAAGSHTQAAGYQGALNTFRANTQICADGLALSQTAATEAGKAATEAAAANQLTGTTGCAPAAEQHEANAGTAKTNACNAQTAAQNKLGQLPSGSAQHTALNGHLGTNHCPPATDAHS